MGSDTPRFAPKDPPFKMRKKNRKIRFFNKDSLMFWSQKFTYMTCIFGGKL